MSLFPLLFLLPWRLRPDAGTCHMYFLSDRGDKSRLAVVSEIELQPQRAQSGRGEVTLHCQDNASPKTRWSSKAAEIAPPHSLAFCHSF